MTLKARGTRSTLRKADIKFFLGGGVVEKKILVIES